ncbi:MAG: hypothetical protein LBF15_03525 [Candidatus Peribacteria bacterium]|nr:hypothetical protein [Candidatus Peribacteria bacterium]
MFSADISGGCCKESHSGGVAEVHEVFARVSGVNSQFPDGAGTDSVGTCGFTNPSFTFQTNTFLSPLIITTSPSHSIFNTSHGYTLSASTLKSILFHLAVSAFI